MNRHEEQLNFTFNIADKVGTAVVNVAIEIPDCGGTLVDEKGEESVYAAPSTTDSSFEDSAARQFFRPFVDNLVSGTYATESMKDSFALMLARDFS